MDGGQTVVAREQDVGACDTERLFIQAFIAVSGLGFSLIARH